MMPRKVKNKKSPTGVILKEVDNGVRINCKQQGAQVLCGLHELWKQKQLCDVVLKAGTDKVSAHRVVLATRSDYFKAMFTVGLEESQTNEVEMSTTNAKMLRHVLEFIYSGNVQVSRNDVQDLLVLADMLQMEQLKQGCCQYLEQHIDVTNCLDMLVFAEQFNCPDLISECLSLLKHRFPTMVQNGNVAQLPLSIVEQILQLEDIALGLEGEDRMARFLLNWFEHDPQSRISNVPALAEGVRWTLVSEEMESQFLGHLLWLDFMDVREQVVKVICDQVPVPQTPRNAKPYIYVIGGYLQSRTGPTSPALKAVERLDPCQNQWQSVADLPFAPSGVFAFTWCGRLLCILTRYQCNSEVIVPENEPQDEEQAFLEYNPFDNKWRQIECESLKDFLDICITSFKSRGTLTWDEHGGVLYVFSESTVSSVKLKGVEDEIMIDKITSLPEIPVFRDRPRRVDYAAVVCRGRLYCFGGSIMYSQAEYEPQSDMYMYDKDQEMWVARGSLIHRRARCAAVVFDGCIYALGGYWYQYPHRLPTVEKYDPITDYWSPAGFNMVTAKSCHSAMVLDGKIYILGGKSAHAYEDVRSRKVLKTCEECDPRTREVTLLAHMSTPRCLAAVAVL